MPVEKRQLSPESLLREAARAIVEENRSADLSGVTILLPNLQVASSLGILLREAAGLPFVLLPEMHTLSGLAAALEFTPESRRMAGIYLALREKNWFRENDLWRLSRELLKLFDELTRWRVALPASLENFSAMLEQAYRADAGGPFLFEARLVHELWHAMESDGLSEAAASQVKLANLAQNASGPLYAIGLDDFTPAEEAFFAAWSQRASVKLFREARSGIFGKVWPLQEEGFTLKSRAEAARSECNPVSNVALFCANSLEEEAEAAQIKIRKWLFEGKRRIALVALDRLAARRTRALLERAQILVSDETGWTFSTTSASTVLARLLDCLASDFYHEDILDLLKSPFIFSDWEEGEKRRAAYFLEQAIRKHSVVSNLGHYARLDLEAEARKALEALRDASRRFPRRAMPLSAWLDTLFDSLEALGIAAGLEEDRAGAELLQRLDVLRKELADEAGRFGFRAWRRWLDMQLESATFKDSGIRSPVVFTHLHAARLREFDAVVLLGCDAAHLPAEPDQGIFFNQAVRSELKLPLMEAQKRRQLDDLAGLLCRSEEVWASWQSLKNGEPNLLSPYLEQLNAFHHHAFGFDLVDRGFSKAIPSMRFGNARSSIGKTDCPAPAVGNTLVPQSISASGYSSLLACPYQYYAGRILGLDPLDEAEKILEKADYGTYLHKILYLFHRRHPKITGLADARGELERLSDEVFRDAVEADYLSHGWALRWKAMIPQYLAWQEKREMAGWKVEKIEEDRSLEIPLRGGKKLVLRGRLDRVDVSSEGLAVIDYKTQSAGILKEKLADPGEDVQLAVYALLLGEPVVEAAFLGLDGEVKEFTQEETGACENRERLAEIFDELYAGARLPAQGLEKVCSYCDMRGLCRKDYWE